MLSTTDRKFIYNDSPTLPHRALVVHWDSEQKVGGTVEEPKHEGLAPVQDSSLLKVEDMCRKFTDNTVCFSSKIRTNSNNSTLTNSTFLLEALAGAMGMINKTYKGLKRK